MRELKGNWLDIFNGFGIALDLRKMFFGLCGIVATVVLIGGFTHLWSNSFFNYTPSDQLPRDLAPHNIITWISSRADFILSFGVNEGVGKTALRIIYAFVSLILFVSIWALFGGAIARTCACEIGKGGERIEIAKSLKFVSTKFSSFFWTPLTCLLGILFFFIMIFTTGLLLRGLDELIVGAPLAALLLPLAIITGLIMTLLILGTIAGFPLFLPAVAAEGTDNFDAVSRSFAYVYSKPWNYIFYQIVGLIYGLVCIGFVIVFAVFMTNLALNSGAAGFEVAGAVDRGDFYKISNSAWVYFLDQEHLSAKYSWNPSSIMARPDPYGRIMSVATKTVNPDYYDAKIPTKKWHNIACYIIIFWLIIVMGLAYGYAISFFITLQSIIYFILRKKVDDIDMNEIYQEEDEASQDIKIQPPVEVKEPEGKTDQPNP